MGCHFWKHLPGIKIFLRGSESPIIKRWPLGRRRRRCLSGWWQEKEEEEKTITASVFRWLESGVPFPELTARSHSNSDFYNPLCLRRLPPPEFFFRRGVAHIFSFFPTPSFFPPSIHFCVPPKYFDCWISEIAILSR